MTDEEPLAALRRALRTAAAGEVADALTRLIQAEPMRWRQLVLVHGGLKDPQASDFAQAWLPLLEAVGQLDGSCRSAARELHQLLFGCATFAQLFASVRTSLQRTRFFEEPWDVQQVRLVAYLESQVILGHAKLSEAVATDGEAFDTHKAQSDLFENERGNLVSLQSSVEGMVDCLELVVRYAQHNLGSQDGGQADLSGTEIPYLDPQLERVLRLANCWREHEDAWTRFKYLGWALQPLAPDEDAVVLTPASEEPFLRAEVGQLRDGQYMIEFWANTRGLADEGQLRPLRDQISRSITVPQAGHEWEGFLDFGALRAIAAGSGEALVAKLWVEAKLYASTVSRLAIQGPGGAVSWDEWLEVVTALREVASAFRSAFLEQVPDAEGEGSVRLAIVVHRDALANVVSTAVDIEPSRCLAVIAALTFDARRKCLEIYDQPLLPLSGDRLIFSPTLVSIGNTSRAIEHFLAQWEDSTTRPRGAEFEASVARIFTACAAARVATRVVFSAQDGKTIEYDVLVWWEDHLLLLECKFLRGVHGPADLWRAGKEIEHATVQLERQKCVALTEWNTLRDRAAALQLPAAPIAQDRITRIVVASVPHFTGKNGDDLFVVDERCLSRYFGESEVAAIILDGDGNRERVFPVASVRRSDAHSVAELLAYLEAPPAVKMFRAGLGLSLNPLPRVDESDPKIAVLVAEFTATAFNETPT